MAKNLFIADAYFKENPQNVMGTQTIRKGRFGSDLIVVKGGENDLDKISVPVIEKIRVAYTGHSSEKQISEKIIQAVIENDMEKTYKAKVQEFGGKHIEKQNVDESKIMTFRESIKKYNKGISREEIEAYLYTNPDINWKIWIDNFTITKAEMIEKGLIYYYKGDWIYKYIYISGNVIKKLQLISQKDYNGDLIGDGKYIVDKFGEEYYNGVVKLLKENKPVDKKICDHEINKKIGDQEIDEKAIVLLPHADIVRRFGVSHTNNMKFDMLLPLNEVFEKYMNDVLRNSDFQEATRDEIIKYYIENKRYVLSSKKDSDKSKNEIAQEKRKEISMKQRTKREGDRLFRKFLVEEVVYEDQIKLEKIWNENYNGIAQVQVEKIPVGFTLNKRFKNSPNELTLNDTQRNGVAYHNVNGSSIIAYDVGVGKTLTCIASISNLIDNGICKYPLIAVPNNTYDKWAGDIQGYNDKERGRMSGALEHLPPLRHLYNMNNELVYELKNYSKEEAFRLDEMRGEITYLSDILSKWNSDKNKLNYELPSEFSVVPEDNNYKKLKFGLNYYVSLFNEMASKLRNTVHDLIAEKNSRYDSYKIEMLIDEATYKKYEKIIDANMDKVVNNFKTNYVRKCKSYINNLYSYELFNSGVLKEIPEGTISLITYEGLNKVGIADNSKIIQHLYEIISQGDKFTEDPKQAGALYKRLEERVNSIEGNPKLYLEDLLIDFMAIDEAHAYKKIFTSCKGDVKQDSEWDSERGILIEGEVRTKTVKDKVFANRENSRYDLSTGSESARALTGYSLSTYIQWKNKRGNIMLLTATPFENNPLEVYSMLSLVAHKRLVENNFGKMKEFFDTFMKIEWDVKLTPSNQVIKDVVLNGFNNLPQMRALIRSIIDHKTGEQAEIMRPDKYVIPNYPDQIFSSFEMTDLQSELMQGIEGYILGEIRLNSICDYSIKSAQIELMESQAVEEEHLENLDEEARLEAKETAKAEAERQVTVDYNELTESEQEGVRIMQGLSFMRSIAWSPYYFKCFRESNLVVSPSQLVETSPKIRYVMECIKSIKKWHEDNGTTPSGQVIYSDGGVEFFDHIRKYLIEKIGYKEKQVAIVRGGMTKANKSGIMKRFLSGEILVLIGSRSIQVGVDLQDNASVLYNLYFYFNPTAEKQAEGRIWRQGNRFGSIRIVYPMCENSADPIMFQYLGEKTLRLKEIWDLEGVRSQLDLKDFDPNKIKNDLITDPVKKATVESILKKDKLEADSVYWQNQVESISKVKPAIDEFREIFLPVKNIVIEFNRQLQAKNKRLILEEKQSKLGAYEEMLKVTKDEKDIEDIKKNMSKVTKEFDNKYNDLTTKGAELIKKLTDFNLKTAVGDEKWDFLSYQMSRRVGALSEWLSDPQGWNCPELEGFYYSRQNKLSMVHEYQSRYSNYRSYIRFVLEPLDISEDKVSDVANKIQQKVDLIEQQLNDIDLNFDKRVDELRKKALIEKSNSKSPEQRAKEFAGLNDRFLSDTAKLKPKVEVEKEIAVENEISSDKAKARARLLLLEAEIDIDLQLLELNG